MNKPSTKSDNAAIEINESLIVGEWQPFIDFQAPQGPEEGKQLVIAQRRNGSSFVASLMALPAFQCWEPGQDLVAYAIIKPFEPPPWRAPRGGYFYSVNDYGNVVRQKDLRDHNSDMLYFRGNYYETQGRAEEVRDVVRQAYRGEVA